MAHITLKDPYLEKRIFSGRLLVIAGLIAGMAFLLIIRYFYLQIIQHENFSTRADANRIVTLPLPPTRGLILDRNGEILADSRASFSLSIVSERSANLDDTLNELRTLLDIRDDEIEKFNQRRKQKNHRPFEPVPLRYRLNDKEIAIIAVNEWRLPGIEVDAQLVRNYPFGDLFAHSIGYMSSINDKDVDELTDAGKIDKYRGMFSIGKLGLEKVYEDELFGIPGGQNVETNARGQALRILDKTLPKPGKDLTLFIDRKLEQLATEKLKDKRGAVIAIEVKTGGVVAAVSTPSYDPNLFVTGIGTKDYATLRDDWQLPLFNRILQGQYPPGSTVKPMIALAGLDYGVVTPDYSISDPGWYRLPNDERFYRDWKKEGHGQHVNILQAITESCDTYFYRLGYQLGVDRLDAILGAFGLGNKTGIDQTGERSGILPSKEWKKKKTRLPWFPGDTLNISIGQGDMLVTPMQLAYATSIIARRGERIVPRFVKSINGVDTATTTLEPMKLNQEKNWQLIFDGMTAVVHSPHGTASWMSRNMAYHMAGKTGTAQVVGIKQNQKYNAALLDLIQHDHALFIAFAPAEDPVIAVAVVVENGEHGSSAAAPIAKAVIDSYLANQLVSADELTPKTETAPATENQHGH